MEPTSHQPSGSPASPDNGYTPTGNSPQTTSNSASPTQPAASGVKAKLDTALESGKKWLNDSGVAEQAQQLPQKAKELGNKAVASVSGLSTTEKAAIVGLVAAGVAFLLTRGQHKKQAPAYRDRPRKSPFDHQPHTKDGDHAYDRRGQRPWGTSRYGAASAPAGKPRVSSGSGYTSSPSTHSPDFGRDAAAHRAGTPGAGPRRDQGPASGSKYDTNTSGGQNPNNLG